MGKKKQRAKKRGKPPYQKVSNEKKRLAAQNEKLAAKLAAIEKDRNAVDEVATLLAKDLVRYAVEIPSGDGRVRRSLKQLPDVLRDGFDESVRRILQATRILEATCIPIEMQWNETDNELRVPARHFARTYLRQRDGEKFEGAEAKLQMAEKLLRAKFRGKQLIPRTTCTIFFGYGVTTYGLARALVKEIRDFSYCTFDTNSFEVAALFYFSDPSDCAHLRFCLLGNRINMDNGIVYLDGQERTHEIAIASFSGMKKDTAELFTRTEHADKVVREAAAEKLHYEIDHCKQMIFVGSKWKLENENWDQETLIKWTPQNASDDTHRSHEVLLITDEPPNESIRSALREQHPHIIPLFLELDGQSVTAIDWPM